MAAASSNRMMPLFWFVLFVFLVPFGVAYLLFDVNQFQVGVILALLGLLVWMITHGAGWGDVEKDTVVLVKEPGNNVTEYSKGSYLYIPMLYNVVARLPSYPLTFEFLIEGIDTQTSSLNKIGKIRVRATCEITNYKTFYQNSQISLIKQIEESTKQKRTEVDLWRNLLEKVAHVYLDDTVRDVVWRWKPDYLDKILDKITKLDEAKAKELDEAKAKVFDEAKAEVLKELDYKPEKDGKPNLDGDPYSLDRNRRALSSMVKIEVKSRLEKNQMGFRIDPLVFEMFEIDDDQIKRATGDRTKEREKAVHEAVLLAEGILKRGEAEAEVRSITLAKLLDVLINTYHIPHTDPLIADVVRASLYSDGQMIWHSVNQKPPTPDAKPK